MDLGDPGMASPMGIALCSRRCPFRKQCCGPKSCLERRGKTPQRLRPRAAYCITAVGDTLFGVEYSGECYCGNKLETGSVAAPAGDCNMPCPGDANKICGAGNRFSLYQKST